MPKNVNAIVDPVPDVPLGRLTEATMDLWPSLVARIPRIPRIRMAREEMPKASPDYSRFDFGYPESSEEGFQEDASEYYQVRGFCVGWGTAQLIQVLDALSGIKTITDRTRPARGRRLSPLYSYALAREYAAKTAGVNLGGGDGAIVSHSVLAAAKYGCLPWESMPARKQIEQQHNNRSFPPDTAKSAGAEHSVDHSGLLGSPEEIEEFMLLARGPVLLGIPWLRGMVQTDGEGWFSVSGGSVGGHCVSLVFIDTENDVCKIKNSHPQYGIRSREKKYAGSGGVTNIGVTKWSAFKRSLLSRSALNNGQSEALGLAGVEGFVPKVKL